MKTFEAASGKFRVFHLGKMQFTVERDGDVLGRFTNLSQAFSFAAHLHRMDGLNAPRMGGWK
jgi:hypothetical protein